jgi:hypothetical protein
MPQNPSPLELAKARQLLAQALVNTEMWKVEHEANRQTIAFHWAQSLMCRMRAKLLPS